MTGDSDWRLFRGANGLGLYIGVSVPVRSRQVRLVSIDTGGVG